MIMAQSYELYNRGGGILQDLLTGALYGLAVVAAGIAILVCAALWYSLYVPGRSHRGPLPPLSAQEQDMAASLRRHVMAIASEPHNVAHYEALEASARYIEESLTALGYEVRPQVYEAYGFAVRNLEATIEPAAGEAEAASIIIGAHYDSSGDAPGANDNGTGVAAVIELARLLKGAPVKRRIRLVLFVNEESPFFKTTDMGSYRYAALLAEHGEKVAGMLSLETLGFYSEEAGSQTYPAPFSYFFPDRADFIAFVGMPGSRGLVHRVIGAFRRHAAFPSIGGVAPGAIPGIDWSDHWSFAQHGFPALMVTDTALFRYPHYHRQTDTPDKIDYERLARLTRGLERAIRDLAE
jgi:peptidase M28-like protein